MHDQDFRIDMGETQTGARGDAAITLGLLSAVEAGSSISQRRMADDLGVALGLVNAYLKRAVAKGLVKVTQAPAKRYAYYLTPKGFAEKSRLTAEYLSQGFKLFREARAQCEDLIGLAAGRGWTRLALAGTGDVCDVAILAAHGSGIEILGIIDPLYPEPDYSGLPVFGDFARIERADAVLIVTLADPSQAFERLSACLPAERILCPPILGLPRFRPLAAP